MLIDMHRAGRAGNALLACGLAGLAVLPGPAAAAGSSSSKPKNAILLSSVQSLTLRAGKMTTHRRVPAVPQLVCTASPQALCDLAPVDVMRCTNQGTGYDDEDIQWSCTASLPPELKLGGTEVVCEGYASRDDPYVLKGSCAVEYRLLLTDYGERRYPELARAATAAASPWHRWQPWLFWAAFVAVLVWIVWRAWGGAADDRPRRPGGGGGFWGGGGGGGGGFDPGFGPHGDPPPPYPGTKPPSPSSQTAGEGWRPGFWSGLAGGAAAGYLAGNRNNRNNYYNDGFGGFGGRDRGYFGGGDGGWGGGGGGGWGGGGPSRPSGSSSSSTRPVSSARHESTGFGSTRRR
ncbi:hypothetical protein SPI_09050 [Niveomyces insectorum RCEF 264]|uniref:Store-operated calcium entry-associated regulatory factor n=1 Tax=Niveomyces insectorum RCEF 264 TaxID=1081102 RepID=A0A167M9X7_9HYPO|nr:hypothetical protein SPI_09050 [Niveomyces insectorum RCEF 264]